jgi:hypothetical protein
MKLHSTFIAALSLAAGVTLMAQSEPRVFVMNYDRSEGPTVAGAPYSATAVTTSTQILGDGTRITRKIEVQLARDSAGRTRRDQTTDAVGPWSTNTKKHVVFIKDPVSQTAYTLTPDEQMAVRISTGPAQSSQSELEEHRAAERKSAAEREAKLKAVTVGGQTVTIIGGSSSKAQTEDLGVQVIEGVNAKGKRETQTIPVGQIGNDRALQIVSETWYSEELQTVIMSKHNDPRVGESEYRLTNISRNEPSSALFEVPAGYSVKEERGEPRRR